MVCVQIDLNNLCRTCKNESPQMKSLYYRDSENGKKTPRLDEMLMACVSVQVNDEDGLPKSICGSCFVQLKNAYSFKEQCEKTDLYLRDYLKNLKKESIKEEIMTDLEFTSNFITEINSPLKDIVPINHDHNIENNQDDRESHWGKSSENDDYTQAVDSNITFNECRTCSKAFYTLEDLKCHKRIHTNTIEDHCMAYDFDDHITTFSNQLHGSGGYDLVVADENMKREIEVSESNIVPIANEIDAEEDPLQMLMKTKIEEEVYRVPDVGETKEYEANVGNGDEYESDASTHSEYLPTKQIPPKMKRDRKRRRKHPVSLKPIDRSRGHHPLLKLKTKPPKNEIGNFPCSQCKEIFTKMSLLEKHAEQHDGLQIHECDSCKKKFTRYNDLRRHKLSHVEIKPYLCMTCKKCFTRRDQLQQHMKLHLSAKVHSCHLCQAVFCRRKNLVKHKASKHNVSEKVVGEKKYKCQYCQKGFTTEKYRDFHMNAHFGDRKFQCKICEKTFISNSHLTEHTKYHSDSSKKFLCSECGQRFIRNDYLVIHMRRHRGEKPFECKLCGKGFTRMTDLTAHEKCHTGEKRHVCVTCGRGFGRAYNLTVHMRTHTGEKPYRCTYCDAAFIQSTDLKNHTRKHTGERFQCELCPKTFLMHYLLTQHKRVVHGLNIVTSNTKKLPRINKLDPDEPPTITGSDPLQIEVSDVKQEQKSDII